MSSRRISGKRSLVIASASWPLIAVPTTVHSGFYDAFDTLQHKLVILRNQDARSGFHLACICS